MSICFVYLAFCVHLSCLSCILCSSVLSILHSVFICFVFLAFCVYKAPWNVLVRSVAEACAGIHRLPMSLQQTKSCLAQSTWQSHRALGAKLRATELLHQAALRTPYDSFLTDTAQRFCRRAIKAQIAPKQRKQDDEHPGVCLSFNRTVVE